MLLGHLDLDLDLDLDLALALAQAKAKALAQQFCETLQIKSTCPKSLKKPNIEFGCYKCPTFEVDTSVEQFSFLILNL